MNIVHTKNGQVRKYTGKYTIYVPHSAKNFGILPCDICDEDFIKKSGSQKRCKKCSKKYNECRGGRIKNPGVGTGHATPSGKDNWNYTTGIKAYRKLRKAQCEKCGKAYGTLDVHHKDKNRLNNSEENLITLCRSCHMKEHRNARND